MFKIKLTVFVLISMFLSAMLLADVDVSVPPGTGLEWDKGMPKPVTTDHGQIQAVATSGGMHDASGKTFEAGVQIEIPVQNLNGYFNIQTPDIADEVIARFEETPEVKNRILTKSPSTSFDYPPTYPTELVWDGISTVIRVMLHTEVVNEHEAILHFIETGSAGYLGGIMVFNNRNAENSASLKKFFTSKLKTGIGLVQTNPPRLPSGKGFKGMMERLAVVEAVSGFPGSLNPQYARKLLSTGKDAIPALLEAAKTKHTFLLRNVTYLLGAYRTKDVQELLADLVNHSDIVVSIRAARALINQNGPIAQEAIEKLLKDRDPFKRIFGIYGVGQVRSRHLLGTVYKMLRSASEKDYYGKAVTWSALEAIARTGTDDKKVIRFLNDLKKLYKRNLPKTKDPSYDKTCIWQPRFPEAVGHLYKVLYEKVTIALAACGDEDSARELLQVDILDVDPVNHFLFVDVLSKLGEKGEFALKQLVLNPPPMKQIIGANGRPTQIKLSSFVQSAALKAVANSSNAQFLEQVIRDKKNHSLMSIALTLLYQVNRGRAKMLCTDIQDEIDLAGNGIGDIDEMLQEKDEAYKKYQAKYQEYLKEKDTLKKQKLLKEYQDLMRVYNSLNQKMNSLSTDNSIFAKQFFAATVLDIGSRGGSLSFEFIEKAATVALQQTAYTHRVGSNFLKEIPKVYMVPAFLECSAVALGRSGNFQAVPILTKILEAQLPSGSSEAALALANFKSRTAYVALLKALDYKDGWTRYCASKALKRLLGQGVEIDWIFGSKSELRSGREKFKKMIEENFTK